MSKKILVLEPTQTIRTIITERLRKSGLELLFETDGLSFLAKMQEVLPNLILINAKNQNPRSIELVRLVKSVDKFSSIPLALYATADFSFEEFYARNCGSDLFFNFDDKTFLENVQKLVALSENKESKQVRYVQGDLLKNAITQKMLDYTENMEALESIIQEYLSMVSRIAEVPAAALFLTENDGTFAYYICSKNFSSDEVRDFLKVGGVDYEQKHSNVSISQIVPKHLKSKIALDRFKSGDIPLSSYQEIPLSHGSLHLVKEGTFSVRQLDLLEFSAKQMSVVLENALSLKKKLFFEKRIRKAFSRFVPEQIIDELVVAADTEDNVAVGEKREVAILFSDIRSFTSISECNKPETIVAFLNRYFTTMVNVIKKHGGTIDKFIGDAIMAEFGCPVSYEDNARRAVAAAYEMRTMLPTVPLEDLVLPSGMKFNIGIGIHYGDVTVGSIGSADKTDYTVIGDSVNLASRLEGLTKTYGTMIVVSESVKEDIKDDAFCFRYLDDVKVKGKAKAVPIYAVDRDKDEFPAEYRDCYSKGLDLYRQGVFNLAKEYFEKALSSVPADKASELMIERCADFIKNPPENWDGAITFHTK